MKVCYCQVYEIEGRCVHMAENANSQKHGTDVWTSKRGWAAPIMPDESNWSEWRMQADNRQIQLLAQGMLRVHDQGPGRGIIPSHVWARSRTSVSIEEKEIFPGGPVGHELIGGLVTYEEALLEYPQPENSDLEHSISTDSVTEGEAITAA